MKHRILNNIWLKIAALLLAFVIWIVVMNTEDPIKSRTYYNVPIIIKNENVITDTGRTFSCNEEDVVVDVTVEAKRSVLSRITSTDIEAVANFKNLNYDSLIPIELRIINFQGEYDSITSNPTNLTVEIKKAEKDDTPKDEEVKEKENND